MVAALKPAGIILFSKRGFSKELEQQADDTLKLFTAEKMRLLLKDVSPREIISGFRSPD